jgi:hypothetical protein
MLENMVICVEILLSLDICVKYAQCVKIWLFLKYVQFPELLCSVFDEAKGDVPKERAFHILVKGDVRSRGASPFYLRCTKKESLQIILQGNAHCANSQHDLWHTYVHIRTCMCANGHSTCPVQEALCGAQAI